MDDGAKSEQPAEGAVAVANHIPGPAPLAIRVRGLVKSYEGEEVVRGVDFDIARGEIFALLGPNGAGKTTTVEILEGFRSRDRGEVVVLGYDPGRHQRELTSHVGIVLQSNGVEPYLTVLETLRMYASFYPHPRPVEEVVSLVGLGAKGNDRAIRLSGGQQRRLDVAIALVGDPDLLFLDEPTTGFDPSARRDAWSIIENLAALGKTVLLTTHYMDEAQHLADAVAVIAAGRIVATGSPDTLGHRELQEARVRYRLDEGPRPPERVTGPLDAEGFVEFATNDATATLHELTGWALEHGRHLDGLEVVRPSLEDVYLTLTAGDPPAPSSTSTSALSSTPSEAPPVGATPIPPLVAAEDSSVSRARRATRAFALTFSQVRYVNKAFWRNPARAFFTFAFPLMFLVIFTSLAGNYKVNLGTRTVTSATYYVASMGAYAVINACFDNLAVAVVFQRESGILKRIKGTPLPKISFLAGRIIHALLIGVVLVAITAAFGRAFYHVDVPTGLTLLRFLIALVLGSAGFCALGLAITGVIPNADSAAVIVNAVILPLLFVSGIFIPFNTSTPSWIVWVARVFPIRHFVAAMQAGFLGTPFSWNDVLVTAGWGLAGLLLAYRYFSWEPTTH